MAKTNKNTVVVSSSVSSVRGFDGKEYIIPGLSPAILHGLGIYYSGGFSAKFAPHAPASRDNRLSRPDDEKLALIILELEAQKVEKPLIRGLTLPEALKKNCATFSTQAAKKAARDAAQAEKAKGKTTKADEKPAENPEGLPLCSECGGVAHNGGDAIDGAFVCSDCIGEK